MIHRALALAAVALSLGLAGCITLFPKEAPAQLYRFDVTPPAPAAAGAAPFSVRLLAIDFDEAAAGDQMLTSTGDQVAYLAGARWEAPAARLFDAAVAHGFDAPENSARLVAAGAAGHSTLRLQLQVTRFEAQYPAGPPGQAPTVVVRMHAALIHEKDMTPAGEHVFEASATAADNHVGSIVQAYDQATSKAVGDLVAWVDQGGS